MKRTRISYKARLLALLLCLCMLPALTACGESRETKRQVSAMNSVMTLTAYGKKAEAGLNAAEGVIVAMDAALDPELPNSTIYTINHSQGQNVTYGNLGSLVGDGHQHGREPEDHDSHALMREFNAIGEITGPHFEFQLNLRLLLRSQRQFERINMMQRLLSQSQLP